MSESKKGKWKKRKIIETKKDGKKFWNIIKDLLEKSKDKDERAYVYTEEGVKKNINEISEEYLSKWKREIYQKTERLNLTFWYGEGQKGKKKEMEEEKKVRKQWNNENTKDDRERTCKYSHKTEEW